MEWKGKGRDMYKLTASGYTVGMTKHLITIEFPLADTGYTIMVIDSIIRKLSDVYIKLYWDIRNSDGEIVDLCDIARLSEAKCEVK